MPRYKNHIYNLKTINHYTMEQTPRNPETMSWDDIRQVLAENSIQLEKNRLLLEENRLQLEENRRQLELSRLQMLDT